ncbi:hypothetical protein CVT26_004006 [Gymnopilus dilepis]|uniref:Uncharacterized protein n=1 Tax=Gymnopilus dilepis TaxID=231916 RepID=A0A409WPL0_9AGAR|nr:hypothetical protein CVT26_004006 [Gymnopilus dilepis]
MNKIPYTSPYNVRRVERASRPMGGRRAAVSPDSASPPRVDSDCLDGADSRMSELSADPNSGLNIHHDLRRSLALSLPHQSQGHAGMALLTSHFLITRPSEGLHPVIFKESSSKLPRRSSLNVDQHWRDTRSCNEPEDDQISRSFVYPGTGTAVLDMLKGVMSESDLPGVSDEYIR